MILVLRRRAWRGVRFGSMIAPVAFVYVGSASGKWHSAVWALAVIPAALVADLIYSSFANRGHGPARIQVPASIQVDNPVKRRIERYTQSEPPSH